MTRPTLNAERETAERQAADWFARLQGEPGLADWAGFQTWLEVDEANAQAYARVERLWVELDGADIARPRASAPALSRRPAFWIGAAAMAAALALAVFVPMSLPRYTGYSTGAGEQRIVALADGSRLILGPQTQLRVRLRARRRDVELAAGEASFDVAHQATRPFVVTVGQHEVRVLGTEFDILSDKQRFAVTVRRGIVAVADRQGGRAPTRLVAGQQFKAAAGAPPQVSSVDPSNAFAWRSGRLVYSRAPLRDVASDLSRYLPIPVTVDPAAKAIPISGVLAIDNEAAMLARLQLFAPIQVRKIDQEYRLTAKAADH